MAKLTLEEQKAVIQDAMIKALAYNDMEKYDNLNNDLVKIEEQLQKEKQK